MKTSVRVSHHKDNNGFALISEAEFKPGKAAKFCAAIGGQLFDPKGTMCTVKRLFDSGYSGEYGCDYLINILFY